MEINETKAGVGLDAIITGQSVKEDERYYVPCPKRKNRARVAVTLCFGCEFAAGDSGGDQINIGCGFPIPTRPKQKRRARPRVSKISRDGLS